MDPLMGPLKSMGSGVIVPPCSPSRRPCVYKGMQQTVKAKVANLLLEKWEAQEASNEGNDLTESEHLYKLFDFLSKTSNNRNSARIILESFVVQKPQRQISLSTV